MDLLTCLINKLLSVTTKLEWIPMETYLNGQICPYTRESVRTPLHIYPYRA